MAQPTFYVAALFDPDVLLEVEAVAFLPDMTSPSCRRESPETREPTNPSL